VDIGLRVGAPLEKTIGDGLFEIFVDLAGQIGLYLQEIIWNREIWSTRRPAVHDYTGHDPHTDHIHAGFTRDASGRAQMPGALLIRVAVLRTGLEELSNVI
jgi:hypothetical protein